MQLQLESLSSTTDQIQYKSMSIRLLHLFKLYLSLLLIGLCISCANRKAQSNEESQIVDHVFNDENADGISDQPVTLRINYILLRNGDGEGGFDQYNEEHMDILRSMVQWMNGSLAANGKMKNPACFDEKKNCKPERSSYDYEHITDTKIRFEIG